MTNDLEKRVYQAFSPEPLKAGQEKLYVDLSDERGNADIVGRLAKQIRFASRPTCQALAGHHGSGKSTELRRLKTSLQAGTPSFFVVFCDSDEDIDRNDIDFPELLIAMIRQLAQQLRDHAEINLAPGYFKDRFDRLQALLGSKIEFSEFDLNIACLKLSGSIKSSPDIRARARQLLEPDTNNWLQAANDLIGEAKLELKNKGYADLVILVDNLDKMIVRPHGTAGCKTDEYLFVNRAAQLTGFACHVVYTIPLSLAYSYHAPAIARSYGGPPPVVPMTKIMTRPPESRPNPNGVGKFRDMIAVRLNDAGVNKKEVFKNDNVEDRLIQMSGGQPTALMLLVREAVIASPLPLDDRALLRAKKAGQREYARQLRADHWPLIEQVRKEGSFLRTHGNEGPFRELLDSRAILQYVNDEEWYGLNPMVADISPPRGTASGEP